jgi:hypothetical protein
MMSGKDNRIRIKQLNCRKQREVIEVLLESEQQDPADILLIQEQSKSIKGLFAGGNWRLIYSSSQCDEPNRALICVSTKYQAKHPVTELPEFTTRDMVGIQTQGKTIINIYNQPNTDLGYQGALQDVMDKLEGLSIQNTIISGDYNLHHYLWDQRRNESKASEIMEWMLDHAMSLASPPYEPTHSSNSVIDLTFASRDTVDKIDFISLSEEQKENLSDHKLQRWDVRITSLKPKVKEIPRYKYQEADWDQFCSQLGSRLTRRRYMAQILRIELKS